MKSSSRSSKRKLKRSQKRSKKKYRSSREKIKKSKRQDHLVSSSDDEDSMSISSGGNDDMGKKRGRSRDKRSSRDKKKKKKRSRSVSESSGDDSPHIKKSKRSKKDRSSDSRKKRSGKKRRRDHSVSSLSSWSRSDDIEGECERKDKKVESKKHKGREKRSGSKRSRHRSKSSSPCSLHIDSGEACSPKRLKSVIVVTKERDVTEEQESMIDERREDEIVCEFDDDYSTKSNDSIDGDIVKDAIPNLHDVSSEKLLDEQNKELVASDIKISEGWGSKREGLEGSERITPQSTVNNPSIGNISEVGTETTGSTGADLEAILRQKALENLLKRQGKSLAKIPGDKKGGNDNIEETKSSIANPQNVDQHMLHDEGNIKSVKKSGQGVEEHIPQDDGNIKSFQKLGKVVDDVAKGVDENIKSEQKVGRGVDDVRCPTKLSGNSVDETNPFKYSDAHLVGKGKVSGNFVNKRPNFSLSMSRNEFIRGKNTWKRQSTPQKDCQEKLLAPTETTFKEPKQQLTASQEDTRPILSRPQESVSKESNRDSSSPQFDSKVSAEKVEGVGVSEPSPSGGKSTNERTSETDEENQFQQKTMSVMRGGEMVQVSYKVYIPNKTPALARRKLKR